MKKNSGIYTSKLLLTGLTIGDTLRLCDLQADKSGQPTVMRVRFSKMNIEVPRTNEWVSLGESEESIFEVGYVIGNI